MGQSFSVEALSTATGGFSEEASIGSSFDQGGDSVVYRGALRVGYGNNSRDTNVVIRQLTCDSAACEQRLLAEFGARDSVGHANILDILGFARQTVPQPRAFLVYPFMPGGTLTSWIGATEGVSERSDGEWRLRVAVGVASALTAMHARGIVHGNVESQNILIDTDGCPKLGDGGETRHDQTHTSGSKRKRGIGVLPYLDPEYCDTGRLTAASDVFSFGVVMLELLTGKPATQIGMRPSVTLYRCFRIGTPEERLQSAVSWVDKAAWQTTGTGEAAHAFAGLATMCTSESSDQRPTAAALTDALQHIQLESVAAGQPAAAGGSVSPARNECVVCFVEPRTIRFGCGHMVTCATCAQELHVQGGSCPVCRHELDAARFEEVSPEANEATYQHQANVLPLPSAQGSAPAHAEGTMNGSDDTVLRLWRDRCPALQALWPAESVDRRGRRRVVDASAWTGVTFCGVGQGPARRVIQIKLNHRGLTGKIPAELGQLAELQRLDLSDNRLMGEIPAQLGGLAALKGLFLSNNRLTGAVPADLGRLTVLEVWALNNNLLTSLPVELGRLGALVQLELDSNQLMSVPAELGRLAALAVLCLSNNRLTNVPAELGQLVSLEQLFLGSNQLTTVPVALRQLRDRGVHLVLDDGVAFE